jgi:transglutaminase-like putative cysteine protease
MNESTARRLARTWSGNVGKLTFLRLSLLWLGLGSVGIGLAAMVEYLQISVMFWTGFFSVLSGWLLARSRLSGWKSSLLALGLGILWLFVIVGRLYRPFGVVFSALFALMVQMGLHRTPFALLNIDSLLDAWNGLSVALTVLLSRMGNWYQGISAGNVVIDPIVTALLWATMVWMVAAWAGWYVRRKGTAFVGLFPGGALLAYNAFYTNSRNVLFWLILLGGIMVILQAVNGYLSAQRRWQAAQMHQANLGPRLTTAVLGITAFLMLTGGLTPSISINEIRNTVNRMIEAQQNQNLAKSLSLEQPPGSENRGSNVTVGLPNLPAQHRVGPGPVVSHEVVMYAAIQDYEPIPLNVLQQIPEGIPPNRYQYWRGQTYETYTGYGWTTHTTDKTDYSANVSLLAEPLTENYHIVRQHIQRVEEQGGALFVIGELVSADQPYHVNWRSSGDLINAQIEADSYDAESRIPDVTVSQLRSAGTDYPASIRSRYLKLPSSLPQRVRNLALDLTASQPTPYDQAAAIEAFLRTFPYSLDVPAPPVNRDVADFFLFDLKNGYCDYYASTMAVMARAAGIPSRLVIGFASGQFDYDRSQFVITLADSHAWVEIYFPGYGWVEFEPTAGLPAIERPGSEKTFDTPTPSAPTTGQQGEIVNPTSENVWPQYIFIILVVILAVTLLALLLPIDRWILLAQPTEAAITTIYRRLYRQGHRWGIEADAARTPHEFATALTSRLEKLSKNERWASTIAIMLIDLDWLTELYTRLLFSPHPLTLADHRQAVHRWRHLNQNLLWLRVIIPFRR